MSFTQDELQSFTTLLDQRLALQRRELERSFDTRLHTLLRSFEQLLASVKRDILRASLQQLSEQNRSLKSVVLQSSHVPAQSLQAPQAQPSSALPDFSNIELHTELPLDDLVAAMSQVLDERFTTLQTALVHSLDELQLKMANEQTQDATASSLSSMHEVIESVERLEHLIEQMQVAMTSNHALLSNRMYHHQQLPLERAHPGSIETTTEPKEATKSSLPLAKF